MESKREMIVYSLIFMLALSLMPLPVRARLRAVDSTTEAAESRRASIGPVLGTLLTRRNGKVLVNGISAGVGATILSGARIETSTDVRATIQISRLGAFDLSPNTIATLEFNAQKITGRLKQGCMGLNTNDNVEGVITTQDGKTTKTGTAGQPGSQQKHICTNTPIKEEKKEKKKSSAAIWPWLLIAAGGSVVVGGLVGTFGRDCCDPSPSSPFDTR